MSMFEQPVLAEETKDQTRRNTRQAPMRWSPSNWSVRWKVLAIVVIPVALAMALGGLRVYNSVTQARDLRQVAERADMVAPIQEYTGALESALLAYGAGTDGPVARKAFDDTRAEFSPQTAGHQRRSRRARRRHHAVEQWPGTVGPGGIEQHRVARHGHDVRARLADG